MKKVLLVHWHPEPKSFCSALFHTAGVALEKAGYQIIESNLFDMDFAPVYGRENFLSIGNPLYFDPHAEENAASAVHGFHPVIAKEHKKLLSADLLILNFPMWWFTMPACLHGWVEKVFSAGVTYNHKDDYFPLRGKKVMLSITTGGPREFYLPGGVNGDIMRILYPLHHGLFDFVGMKILAPQVSYQPASVSQEERENMLRSYEQRLRNIETEVPVVIQRE